MYWGPVTGVGRRQALAIVDACHGFSSISCAPPLIAAPEPLLRLRFEPRGSSLEGDGPVPQYVTVGSVPEQNADVRAWLGRHQHGSELLDAADLPARALAHEDVADIQRDATLKQAG